MITATRSTRQHIVDVTWRKPLSSRLSRDEFPHAEKAPHPVTESGDPIELSPACHRLLSCIAVLHPPALSTLFLPDGEPTIGKGPMAGRAATQLLSARPAHRSAIGQHNCSDIPIGGILVAELARAIHSQTTPLCPTEMNTSCYLRDWIRPAIASGCRLRSSSSGRHPAAEWLQMESHTASVVYSEVYPSPGLLAGRPLPFLTPPSVAVLFSTLRFVDRTIPSFNTFFLLRLARLNLPDAGRLLWSLSVYLMRLSA